MSRYLNFDESEIYVRFKQIEDFIPYDTTQSKICNRILSLNL